MNRVSLNIAVAVFSVLMTSSYFHTAAAGTDQMDFAKKYGMIALVPPRSVDSQLTNLWHPGTVVWFKDRKKLQPVPTCENIFDSKPPTITQIFGNGEFESKNGGTLNAILNLFSKIIKKATGSINAKFSWERHIVIKFTSLFTELTTDETLSKQIGEGFKEINKKINKSCLNTLTSQAYSENNNGQRNTKFPIYVVRSTGMAKKISIETSGEGKKELGVDFKVADAFEINPSLQISSTNKDSLDPGELPNPLAWGIELISLRDLKDLGRVSSLGENARISFNKPEDSELEDIRNSEGQ